MSQADQNGNGDKLSPGQTFIDFEAVDHGGTDRRLSEIANGDPLVLHFYRGWWCPKEQQFLRNLVELQAEAEVAYTGMVSVTVDPPELTAPFRAGLGARWPFLSDPDRTLLDQLGLEEHTDPVHRPYLPYAFVLYPDLVVHSAYNGYWYWGRATNEEIRRDLREVTRDTRGNEWDIRQGPS